MKPRMSRKHFLLLGLTALAGLILAALSHVFTWPLKPAARETDAETPPAREAAKPKTSAEPKSEDKEENKKTATEEPQKRKLGKTGEAVSLFGLGGAGIIAQGDKEEEAVALLERALDEGVNYIDTAPSYADGISERHIGRVMNHRRKEAFLATKTLDRTYDGTMRAVEKSLERLQTDYLDLYQIHGIRNTGEVDEVLQQKGAVRALLQLQEEGTVKYTGVTGHRDPRAIRYLLDRQEFDCVLMPLNPADVHEASFQEGLLPYAEEKGMGVIAMKVFSYGRLLRPEGVATAKDALQYVCTLPIHTAIVGLSSMEELEENLSICREFRPLPEQEMNRLEKLAEPYQTEANFYKEW